MKILNIAVFISVLFFFIEASTNKEFIDISQLQKEASQDSKAFISKYKQSKFKIKGRVNIGFWTQDGISSCNMTGLVGDFSKPSVGLVAPSDQANEYKKIKHKDTLFIETSIDLVENGLIVLKDFKIIKHNGYAWTTKKLKSGTLRISAPKIMKGTSRSRADIMKVIMKQTANVKDVYNNTLQTSGDIEGKALVQFSILENGNISKCSIVSSTLNHKLLENELLKIVRLFKFTEGSKDIVEVTYPFVFSMHKKF